MKGGLSPFWELNSLMEEELWLGRFYQKYAVNFNSFFFVVLSLLTIETLLY